MANYGGVKRYRLISPETYERLSLNSVSDPKEVIKRAKSRSPSPEDSNWQDVLLMLPKYYRRNA